MLRASATTPKGPLLIAGLAEGNIERLKAGYPIDADLDTFIPGMEGRLVILYGKTHADLESTLLGTGGVTSETARSSDAGMEQQEAAMRGHKHILICTVGLPRSGKSTWARSQAWPIVNPDSVRLAIHGHRFVADAEPFVWATAKVMVRALFMAGHKTVILDATNTTKKRRVEWFDDRWATFFKVIETSKETCVERATKEGDMDILPVIERQAAQYEKLDGTCKQW